MSQKETANERYFRYAHWLQGELVDYCRIPAVPGLAIFAGAEVLHIDDKQNSDS